MPSQDTLAGLSDRQREAATHLNGPLLIVAGPGSGKTRVMAHRVAHLIGVHGIRPGEILAVTFTNKAARELRDRCEHLVPNSTGILQVRTFHGFCAWLLRWDGGRIGLDTEFSIYDTDDQTRVVRSILDEFDLDPKQLSPGAILSAISGAKNRMLDDTAYERMVAAQRFPGDQSAYFHEVVSRVYRRYVEMLDTAKAVDFDDLLLKAHVLLESAPDVLERYQDRFTHLLIDEFQDTNPLQFSIARLLAAKNRNITVVGDPDQSIYSWRHADPGNLNEFQKVFSDAKVVTLDQSYRSTQIILEAADAVISNNDHRLPKHLWTENDRGRRVYVAEAYDEEEEARAVVEEINRLTDAGFDPAEVAVMYRVNAQSRAVEGLCNRMAVPYRLVGGVKFYERREVRDVLSYLRLAHNPADDAALARIINTPRRGISDRTVEVLRRVARARGTPMLDAVFAIAGMHGEDSDAPETDLKARALNALKSFGELMERLIEQSLSVSPHELIDLALERSGYARLLQEDQERGEERWENVKELRGAAEQFGDESAGNGRDDPRGRLAEFLENVALVSDVDRMDDGRQDAITLITLHQAKGLEFDAVFIVGLEEGLLPHSRSMDDAAQLQEERRLCYVGMTRARKRLYMLHAFQRGFRGTRAATVQSRFIGELPPDLVSFHQLHAPGRRARRTALRDAPSVRDPMAVKNAATMPMPGSAAAPAVDYSPGDRVRHSSFGEGVVVSATEARGDTEVTVAFSGGQGVRRLLVAYAPMEKLDSGDEDGGRPPGGPDPEADPFVDPP